MLARRTNVAARGIGILTSCAEVDGCWLLMVNWRTMAELSCAAFKYAGGWVAANDLLAVPGVDGALPRRHAPPFPSGARPPGQKRQHHVPLSVWSAAVLSRCPGRSMGTPVTSEMSLLPVYF